MMRDILEPRMLLWGPCRISHLPRTTEETRVKHYVDSYRIPPSESSRNFI